MAKCGSNLSTFTLTILKEQTYLCRKQLSDDKPINNYNKDNKDNIKPAYMNKNMYRDNICADVVVWELEEVTYSGEPIFI